MNTVEKIRAMWNRINWHTWDVHIGHASVRVEIPPDVLCGKVAKALETAPEDVSLLLDKVQELEEKGPQSREVCCTEIKQGLVDERDEAVAHANKLEDKMLRLRTDLRFATTCCEIAKRRRDAAETHRKAYRRDWRAESAGAALLGKKHGQLDTETFPDFVERLASERDVASQRVDEYREQAEAENKLSIDMAIRSVKLEAELSRVQDSARCVAEVAYRCDTYMHEEGSCHFCEPWVEEGCYAHEDSCVVRIALLPLGTE